jgi:predicted HicB family RNase H-like nuclease
MAKTETLNLRVSHEFKRKLMDAAAKQKRSVTNYLEVVLNEVWDRERLPASATTRAKKPRD